MYRLGFTLRLPFLLIDPAFHFLELLMILLSSPQVGTARNFDTLDLMELLSNHRFGNSRIIKLDESKALAPSRSGICDDIGGHHFPKLDKIVIEILFTLENILTVLELIGDPSYKNSPLIGISLFPSFVLLECFITVDTFAVDTMLFGEDLLKGHIVSTANEPVSLGDFYQEILE